MKRILLGETAKETGVADALSNFESGESASGFAGQAMMEIAEQRRVGALRIRGLTLRAIEAMDRLNGGATGKNTAVAGLKAGN